MFIQELFYTRHYSLRIVQMNVMATINIHQLKLFILLINIQNCIVCVITLIFRTVSGLIEIKLQKYYKDDICDSPLSEDEDT